MFVKGVRVLLFESCYGGFGVLGWFVASSLCLSIRVT